MQPLAVAVENLAEGQLGLQAKTELARNALINDMLNRCSTRKLTPVSRRSLPQLTVDSTEESKGKQLLASGAGSCVSAVMQTFNSLILSLADTANVAPGFPERLMDLYWQYHASVGALLSSKCSSRRSIPASKVTMPNLCDKAVCALMAFALNYPLMDELMWSQILKAFNFSLRQCPKLSINMAEFDSFQPFLECFCGSSLIKFNTYSIDSTFGPAIDRAFGVFMELLLKTPSANLLNKIFDCLAAIFSKE
uniref:Uncharacterized protein n=1 Tax=Ditylenchus dipsaci TaxID=166011 RepID=A0A915EBE6_9BILA